MYGVNELLAASREFCRGLTSVFSASRKKVWWLYKNSAWRLSATAWETSFYLPPTVEHTSNDGRQRSSTYEHSNCDTNDFAYTTWMQQSRTEINYWDEGQNNAKDSSYTQCSKDHQQNLYIAVDYIIDINIFKYTESYNDKIRRRSKLFLGRR